MQNHFQLPSSRDPRIAGNNSNFHQQRIQSAETNVRVVWQKLKRIKRKTRENFGRYSRPNWHLRSDRRGGSAVEVNWGLDGEDGRGWSISGLLRGVGEGSVSRREEEKKEGKGRERKGGEKRRRKSRGERKVEAHYRWACVSKPPKADLKEGKKEATLACLIAICKYWECFPALRESRGERERERERELGLHASNQLRLSDRDTTGWIHRFARIIRLDYYVYTYSAARGIRCSRVPWYIEQKRLANGISICSSILLYLPVIGATQFSIRFEAFILWFSV